MAQAILFGVFSASCFDYTINEADTATSGTGVATEATGSGATSNTTSDSAVMSGVGGAGGAAGSGGVGGSEVCQLAEDCDDPGPCQDATCENGRCGSANVAGSCTIDGIDAVCSEGECVECVSEVNCESPSACQVATCAGGVCRADDAEDGQPCDGGSCLDGACEIDPLCANSVLDPPNETDVDCGGTCPRCVNGSACTADEDCQSGFCNGTSCAPCGSDDDCAGKQFCDSTTSVCLDDMELGGPCDREAQCFSSFCADGFCCESACDGICEACGALGACTPVAEATDPADECTAAAAVPCLTGSCNGARSCGVKADGEAGTPACADGFLCDATPGGSCPGVCVSDFDCVAQRWCAAPESPLCIPDLGLGEGCSRSEQCASGLCAGGTCQQ